MTTPSMLVPRRRSVAACLALAAAALIVASVARASGPQPLVDGEPWIAYDSAGILLIRPDGSGQHRLFDDVPGLLHHPDWSPDGDRIAFSADDTDGTTDLWVGSADGTGAERLYDCMAPCVWADHPAWSPDGDSILFQQGTAIGDTGEAVSTLEVIDLASGASRTLATSDPGDFLNWPRWAPDGDAVVIELDEFATARLDDYDVVGSTIAIVDLTTDPASVHELLPRDRRAGYPDWRASGDRIVFQMPVDPEQPDGPSDLHVMEPSGEGLTTITIVGMDGRQAIQPTWTPDGSGIIFVEQDADYVNTRMATVPASGGDRTSATGATSFFGTHPRLRPGS